MLRYCLHLIFALLPLAALAGPSTNPIARAGAVQVGDRFTALQARAPWQFDPDTSYDDCRYYLGGLLPKNVAMMVEGDVVQRFDLHESGTPGPFGIRIGDTGVALQRKLPSQAVFIPAAEAKDVARWRWPASPASHGFALQADLAADGRIDHLSWGRAEAVHNLSACL